MKRSWMPAIFVGAILVSFAWSGVATMHQVNNPPYPLPTAQHAVVSGSIQR